MYCQTITLLVIDTATGNPLERILNLTITIDDKIRDEKLQYDSNREVTKYLHYH